MEFPEVSFRTIELIHDISRRQWGIPVGEGRYYWFSQEAIDYVNNLEIILEFINGNFGLDLPINVFEVMRTYRNEPSRYIKIPILNPIDWSTFYAGVDDEYPHNYI